MAGALRRAGLALALPGVVGIATLLQWLAGRRLHGLWILPDEAIYGERALALWQHGRLSVLNGEGAGYGFLYPALAGLPLSVGKLATGYASLKLLQALVMSLVAVPVFFYGRRQMRPAYALIAASLALVSPLVLYSGFLMTEVLIYPVGALALFAIARAIETTTLGHQAVAFGAIGAATLTRVQAVVLVAVFVLAILIDAALARTARRMRAFWPVWSLLVAVVATVAVAPGVLGAYAGTLHGGYPLHASAALVAEHFAYLVLSTVVLPALALVLLLIEAARGRETNPAARTTIAVAVSAIVCVVVQVGFFAARYAPHLLGRDLALLPPLLFAVFALWLDRGAPRPRGVALPAAAALLGVLLLTPWHHLVSINALPDTFGIVVLYHFRSAEALIVAVVATVALAAALLVPRRWILLFPTAMVALLVTSSVIASDDIADRVAFDQHELVGIPPNWIDLATHAPAAYLYDAEPYWNGVWQAHFWNRQLADVLAVAPTRVPGPMPQRLVRIPADGQLRIREHYIVATDSHAFVGEPVAHLNQPETDPGGSTVWHLDGAPRLATIRQGIEANGDMTEPGLITAYDCAGGRLELTLLPKSTSVVTLLLDGRVVQRTRIAGLAYWNGTMFVPPSPSPRVCQFEIDGQNLLGSTRIAFVHR
jgi:hypothetical protein